jgi:hypothetical protein
MSILYAKQSYFEDCCLLGCDTVYSGRKFANVLGESMASIFRAEEQAVQKNQDADVGN